MPAEKRRKGSLASVILLITVGLAGKVFAWNSGRGRVDELEISAAQRYFDAVAPEDRETFIKFYLDKALEERIPDHTSTTPADFSFITYQESQSKTAPLASTSPSPTPPPSKDGPNLPSVVELVLDGNDRDIYNYVKYSLVCYSSGCIDPTDIATICCPF